MEMAHHTGTVYDRAGLCSQFDCLSAVEII
jgi:hypothetical protein